MILCVRFKDNPPPPAAAAVLEGVSPAVQWPAPDCALLDVRGARRYFGTDAAGLASVVRVRALAYAGAECAIGVAPTPMLARMAAREAAQGTTFVVPDGPRETAAFLAPRLVDALPGIGAATARTLRSYGLGTVASAADVPLATLQRILGMRLGREVYEKAHGIDRTVVVPDAGHGHRATNTVSAHREFPHDELDRG
jgi:nucleotidyltransferase/DNA polymerase involved in DNA repair